MGSHEPALSSAKPRSVTRSHPWLGVLMEAVDRRLRCRLGVIEYTRSSDCILRMQIIRNADYVLLKDGTCLRPDDRIIDLHFWNQQVPLMPEAGPTLGWACRMNDSFKRSLQELAHHLAARTDVDDIVAIRAIAALGVNARGDKISRILSRFGFEIVLQQETPSAARQIRRYGENILISLMVLAYNAIALRPDTLGRGRVPAYLSRRELDERYGAAPKSVCGLPACSRNLPVRAAPARTPKRFQEI
jgi:hypothetical protein